MIRLLVLALGGATVLAGCVGTPRPAQADSGRVLAERKCSGCHAVAVTGLSPNAAAPPFRDLYRRYPVESLRAAFVNGVRVAHAPMPKFVMSPAEVDQLLVYLKGLDPCAAASSDEAAMRRCFERL